MSVKVVVLTLFTLALVAGCTGSGGSASGGSAAPPLTECQASGTNCRIGDAGPGGGVVFYDAGSQQTWGRYLETVRATWSGTFGDPSGPLCTNKLNASTDESIGAGQGNTSVIFSIPCVSGMAKVVSDYNKQPGNAKSDWFIPSLREMEKLWSQSGKNGVPRLTPSPIYEGYWTSTARDAFGINFLLTGNEYGSAEGYLPFDGRNGFGAVLPGLIRPIRAF